MDVARRGFFRSVVQGLSSEPEPALYVANDQDKYHTQRAPLAVPSLAVAALNRMAFGPRPGDIAAFNALGATDAARMQAYVDQQLNPAGIDDSELEARLAGPDFMTLDKSLTQLWAEHYRADGVTWEERIRPSRESYAAKFMRAVLSKRQLVEVLSDFWHDHFSIYGYDSPQQMLWSHYDNQVIRPYVLGNFREMLEANAKSTPMLYYLDNVTSSDDGPNENYARELLELHTLGAENYLGVLPRGGVPLDGDGRPVGFGAGDVQEVARCLTGWTVSNGHWSDPTDLDTGEFLYRDYWHDRFLKYVLREFIPSDQAPLADGLRVLDKLAEHPGTARFICRKLCRRLIAGNPPDSVVQSAAAVFHTNWQAADQIALTVRHILLSPEFATTWGAKHKRPFETVVSAMRACDSDINMTVGSSYFNTFRWLFDATGHRPWGWSPPNGYPDRAEIWLGSSSLVRSWRMLHWLLDGDHIATGNGLDVLQATLDAPELANPAERTPRNLAAFWYQRLLGYQPEPAQLLAAAEMLRQSDSRTTPIGLDDAIDLTTNSWPDYWQEGLRALVGLILTSPEFLRK